MNQTQDINPTSPLRKVINLSIRFELKHPLEIRLATGQHQEGMKFENGRHLFMLFPEMGVEEMYEHFARAKAGEFFGSSFETYRVAEGTPERQALLLFSFIQIISTTVAYRMMRLYLPDSVVNQEINFMYDYYLQEIRSESSLELWTLAMHVMLADQGKIGPTLPLKLFRYREVANEAFSVLQGTLDDAAMMRFFNRFGHLHGMEAAVDNGTFRLSAYRV